MTDITEEMVELVAKAVHDYWQNGGRSWDDTCKRMPGQAKGFRVEARAACEAVVPMVVKGERERAELDDDQKVADAYQIVSSLADAFGVHDHPEVVRAMDWLAYGKTEDGSAILPWPREPLTAANDAPADPEETE